MVGGVTIRLEAGAPAERIAALVHALTARHDPVEALFAGLDWRRVPGVAVRAPEAVE